MNFCQKLNQPAVRAETAEEWGLAASEWQTLLTQSSACRWRVWVRDRIHYCRAHTSALPRRH